MKSLPLFFAYFGVVSALSLAVVTNAPAADYSVETHPQVIESHKKAMEGDPQAQYQVGYTYVDGTYGITPDYKKGVYWLKKAARKGYAHAQFLLGYEYEIGRGTDKDTDQALNLYRLAAEQGEPDAQYRLGNLYREGKLVDKNPSLALSYYFMARSRGEREKTYNDYLETLSDNEIIKGRSLICNRHLPHGNKVCTDYISSLFEIYPKSSKRILVENDF